MPGWYEIAPGGLRLRVRLTPRGGCDRVDGVTRLSDGARVLAARVRAAPEKGAANAALERLVARALGVARATVTVASGHRSRLKQVHVSGEPQTLRAAADTLARDGEEITT